MYNQTDRTAPISMEEVKSLAKDFVLAHKMTADGKLNIMGSGYGSNIAMVLYENGKDGVVQVQVNPLSGKIEGFSYMTKSRAQLFDEPGRRRVWHRLRSGTGTAVIPARSCAAGIPSGNLLKLPEKPGQIISVTEIQLLCNTAEGLFCGKQPFLTSWRRSCSM